MGLAWCFRYDWGIASSASVFNMKRQKWNNGERRMTLTNKLTPIWLGLRNAFAISISNQLCGAGWFSQIKNMLIWQVDVYHTRQQNWIINLVLKAHSFGSSIFKPVWENILNKYMYCQIYGWHYSSELNLWWFKGIHYSAAESVALYENKKMNLKIGTKMSEGEIIAIFDILKPLTSDWAHFLGRLTPKWKTF